MSWYSDAPEDEAISLLAGLLANPDMTLSLRENSLYGRVTTWNGNRVVSR